MNMPLFILYKISLLPLKSLFFFALRFKDASSENYLNTRSKFSTIYCPH